MRRYLIAAVIAALAACSPPTPAPKAEAPAPKVEPAPSVEGIPAGSYTLDKYHASLDFRVSHLGFSNYTARFTRFDATLQFDPANPAASSITATVDPNSLAVPTPPPGFLAELKGPQFLDTAKFKEITFKSTKVEVLAGGKARITGDFTLHGVTQPLVLEARFNGGYPGYAPMDPNARIGFSATGVIKRSAHGIGYGIPAPGTRMGVSDDVNVIIEAEFTGPPLAAAPAEPAKK
jgi:polyisoprenoid-binding protein YceI